MEFQKPRLVVSREGEIYVAQFITPKDVQVYGKVVKAKFLGDSKLLNTYTDEGKGSSLVANMVMSAILVNSGWMIADLPQLYDANRTFDKNKVNGQDSGLGLSTRNCYSDARFVIRAKTDGTAHILDQIGDKKLTAEGKGGVLKAPISFALFGILPSPNGPLQEYSFKLTDQAKFAKSEHYSMASNGKRFSFFDSEGNPVVSEDGVHTIYNNDNAVVGVYANDALALSASCDDLRDFNVDGRVVKYRAVGTEKSLAGKLTGQRNANLDEAVQRVNEEHYRKLEEIAKIRKAVGA